MCKDKRRLRVKIFATVYSEIAVKWWKSQLKKCNCNMRETLDEMNMSEKVVTGDWYISNFEILGGGGELLTMLRSFMGSELLKIV